MGNEETPDTKKPHHCLPGLGCSPLVGLSSKTEMFLAQMASGFDAHQKESIRFWSHQKEEFANISLQIKECLEDAQKAALNFNDGHHEMLAMKTQAATDRQDSQAAVAGLGVRLDRENRLMWWAVGVLSGGTGYVGGFLLKTHTADFLGWWLG